MRFWYVIIIIVSLVCSMSCTPQSAGGISDHGNERVAGVVATTDGAPAAGVLVTLLPDDYNHITDSTLIAARETVTDSNGRYVFDSLDKGAYTILADDSLTSRAGIVKNVVVDENSADAPKLTINVMGNIYFPVDSNLLRIGMMVYLPGLKCYDVVDTAWKVHLFNVPSGCITVKAYDPVTETEKILGKDFTDIEIIPGVTLLLPSRSPQPYCLKDETIVECVSGYAGEVFTFSPIHPSEQIDGNFMYRFSWGEGTISNWSSDIRWYWSWDKPGSYFVQSQVMRQGSYHTWSEHIYVEIFDKE
jgi:hypothetical protein